MSYLLFTSRYTRDLIEIGYQDADERIDEIEDFLYSSREGDAGNGSKTAAAAKRSESPVRSRG
jgi:NTE family protein